MIDPLRAAGEAARAAGAWLHVDGAYGLPGILDQRVACSGARRGRLGDPARPRPAGVRARVIQDNDLARRLSALAAAHPRLESLTEPELSIACVRYVRDGVADLNRLNAALLRRLIHESDFLPSSTLVDSKFAIRLFVINGRTRAAQVDELAAAMVRLGDELTAS